MAEPVSATVHIDATPEEVYALVSDLPRMGEWSPENTGGTWLKGATAAAPGARFKGTNKNGSKSWSTTATVVEATPGKAFVFDISVGPVKVARWSYRMAAAPGGGCEVTESWEDQRNGLGKRLGGIASGVKDRATYTKASIETTLANLKAAAEAA
jgi:uncharacterized protein YndB with AHSA1/START domain